MKKINFGIPESDAAYLIGGFSGSRGRGSVRRRFIGQVARMRLFLPEGESNKLTLDVWYDRQQQAELLLNGVPVGTAQVEGAKKAEQFIFELPAEQVKSENVLEFRCKRPHPLDAHQPRCLELESLEIEKWREPKEPGPETPKYNLYFGDIHVHSNLSPCGYPNNGTLEENYQWAREDGWDFIAIADHDTFMSDKMWRQSIEASEKYNDPGTFAALFAYEWTSFFYGQMNVYSTSPKLPLCRCTDYAYDSPPKLWGALRKAGVPAFSVYHHMAAPGWATTWDYNDPEMLPLIEIYSVWRSSETPDGYCTHSRKKLAGSTARDALARGFRVGFIGGGDTHQLRPGTRGIAGVYAAECTREAIWEALKAKRCYATTGVNIELEFSIAGVGMGGQITFTPYTQDTLFPALVSARAKGTAPIKRIEVIENGEVLYCQHENFGLHEVEIHFQIENSVRKYNPSALSNPSRYYYLRVTQEDGNMAWSSPIYFVRDWSGIE